MAWRIYYDNETTFSSEDGTWSEAPSQGVLAVVEVHGEARTIRSGGDFYRLCSDGTVIASEDAHAILTLVGNDDVEPLSAIKFGRFTSAGRMERVFRRIREARD